jgi:peptide/nickel transport system ATP-binding protein
MLQKAPILSVRDLSMVYQTRKGPVSAIDGVSFELRQGESFGLVGESGCGKTSLAMMLLRLAPENALVTKGEILVDGADLLKMSDTQVREVRWARIAMIFQAAMNSLDPVYPVGEQILEAIFRHQPAVGPEEARERVSHLFQLVGIDPRMQLRYPHEFSGGMRQRAVIAMALACSPGLIIADEPTTALDVIVQDQVLRELRRIQKALNMSMVYISHDIAVIAEVSERIGVMYAGRLVEIGSSQAIFRAPRHPYTAALMSAFPSIRGPKTRLTALAGEPPDLLNPPSGCRFHPRCPRALEKCHRVTPVLDGPAPDHTAACWNPVEVAL